MPIRLRRGTLGVGVGESLRVVVDARSCRPGRGRRCSLSQGGAIVASGFLRIFSRSFLPPAGVVEQCVRPCFIGIGQWVHWLACLAVRSRSGSHGCRTRSGLSSLACLETGWLGIGRLGSLGYVSCRPFGLRWWLSRGPTLVLAGCFFSRFAFHLRVSLLERLARLLSDRVLPHHCAASARRLRRSVI